MKNSIPLPLIALLIVSAGAPRLYADRPIKGDDLSNMIIAGKNRLTAGSEPPKLDWAPDLYRDVAAAFGDEALFLGMKPPAVKNPPLTLPDTSATTKTASPWLSTIFTAPILTLHFKADKAAPKAEWAFLIKDSRGQVFHQAKRKGALPETITWDGFGEGKPLRVGDDYTYSVAMVDEAGNPQRFSGNPFRLDTFRYRSGGVETTAIAPGALFTGDNQTRFSKGGLALLSEAKDGLMSNHGATIEAVVYEDDASFALARANAVRDYLKSALDYPDDKIKARGVALKGPAEYRHVEIIRH